MRVKDALNKAEVAFLVVAVIYGIGYFIMSSPTQLKCEAHYIRGFAPIPVDRSASAPAC